MPKVSVIIPTYNQEQFIEETIESVLSQTYRQLEVIVTDDGSLDKTPNIIKKYALQYKDTVVPVLSPMNTGIAANLNRGLAKVSGEYIAWLGGDDLMLSEKLEKQVGLLEKRPDAVGCCHDAEVFDSGIGEVLGVFSELYNGERGFREGGVELWLKPDYLMLPSTVMIRTSAVPEHGFDERLRYTNDWLFDIEVFRNGKCLVINEVIGKYRRHSSNITSSSDLKCLSLEEKFLVLSIVDARYPELHNLVRKYRTVLFLKEAAKSYVEGDGVRFSYCIKAAAQEGARFRAAAVYLGTRLFRGYISRQVKQQIYNRPHWLKKMIKKILAGR